MLKNTCVKHGASITNKQYVAGKRHGAFFMNIGKKTQSKCQHQKSITIILAACVLFAFYQLPVLQATQYSYSRD